MILISFEEAQAYRAYRERENLTEAQVAALAKLDKRCLDHLMTFGPGFAAYAVAMAETPKEPA